MLWDTDHRLLKQSHSQGWDDTTPGVQWRLLEGFYTKIRVDQSWGAGQFRESKSRTMDDLLFLKESLMFQWLRKDVIRRILMEHRAGKRDNHKILVSLVAFEEWLRSTSH